MTASLRALLAHTVDYAGLFPPASLELEPALTNQAEYVRSSDHWMLGAFILPIAKFRAAEKQFALFNAEHPLQISALGRAPENADAFVASLRAIVAAAPLLPVNSAILEQAEMPLPKSFDKNLLDEALSILGKLRAFWETPAEAAPQAIELLAKHRALSGNTSLGCKLRTGGVTADAFPSPTQVARALAAAVQHRVPIKFTAGLHHPVRQYHESVQTKMHGFLNVFGAGVLAAEHGWDEAQIGAMLEDEVAASFSFGEEEMRWSDWKISTARIAEHRRLVTSFGSCSFEEPREDLQALGLW